MTATYAIVWGSGGSNDVVSCLRLGVFDFTSWTTGHPGNDAFSEDNNPIKAPAQTGAPTVTRRMAWSLDDSTSLRCARYAHA